MTELMTDHLSLVYTLYGMAFIVLGIVAFALPRQDATLRFAPCLWLLGMFGLLHGTLEFIQLERLHNPASSLTIVSGVLTLASYATLLEFGRRVLTAGSGQVLTAASVHGLTAAGVVSLVLWASDPITGLTVGSRYFVGAPGALLTGLAMLAILREHMPHFTAARLSGWLRAAAFAFLAYAGLTLFISSTDPKLPGWLPTEADFLALTAMPVQLARTLCALAAALALVVMVRRAGNLNRDDMQRVLDGINGFIYRCKNDPDWTLVYMTGKVEELCGHPPAHFLTQRKIAWGSLIQPEDATRVWEEVQTGLGERRDFELTYRIRHSNGEIRWVYERGRGIFASDGTLRFLEGHITDATSLMRANEALRMNAAAIESSITAIAMSDMDGHITYVNPAFVKLWKFNSAHDALGRSHFELLDDPATTRSVIATLQRDGRWQGELRARRSDGNLFDIEISANVVNDNSGAPLCMMASFLDITERRQAERALRDYAELLDHTQAMAHLGSWEWDIATGELNWSDEHFRIYGHEPGTVDASFDLFAKAVHPDDRERVLALVDRAVQDGTAYDAEFRICRPDGSMRVIAARGQVRRDAYGQPLSMFGMSADITEHRAAENAVRAAQARVQAVIDASSQVAIIATNIQGNITLFNTGAEHMLGYRAEEMMNKTPEPFHLPIEMSARAEALTRDYGQPVRGMDVFLEPARRGDTTPREWTYVRKDHSHLTVNLAVTAQRDDRGQIIGYLGVATDITARAELLTRLNKIGRNAPGMIYQYRLHVDGTACFPYSSDGIRDIYGVMPSEVVTDASPVFAVLHPGDIADIAASIDFSARNLTTWHAQYRVNHPTKGEIWVEGRSSPERLTDGSVMWHGAIFDITQRKRAELALERSLEELRQSEQRQRELLVLAQREQGRMAALLSGMSIGILFEDREGHVEYVNPAFRRMWAINENIELGGRPTRAVLEHSTHRFARPDHASKHVLHVLDTHEISERFEVDLYDGRILTQLSYPVSDAEGRILGRLWIYEDVTHERQTAQQLVYLAEHDPLTGLHNRHRFQKQLDWMIKSAQRSGARFALLYFDLDEFKYINDTFGHRAGDTVLVRTAGEIAGLVRGGEMFARLGGDEFAILTELAGNDEPTTLAERVAHAISAIPFRFRGSNFRLTASIGIALFPEHGDNTEDLVAHADAAMYQAKNHGKNTWALYDSTRNNSAIMMERMNLVSRIGTALEEGLFELHFQGIYHTVDRHLSHLEVLVRMQDRAHPEQLIMPGQFIPVAEKSGQILEIDRWVLRHSIETLASHPQLSALAVNISGRSFDEPGLPQYIHQLLHDHAVAPERLIIELTETAAVSEMQDAQRFIEALQKTGCSVCLDDFGSGFSTFAYLKYLGVQALKIDGIFIRDLPNNPDNQAFVRAMVDVARGLNKTTVAEFVEDGATLEMLRYLGVDMAQGYHLDRPCPDHPGLQKT